MPDLQEMAAPEASGLAGDVRKAVRANAPLGPRKAASGSVVALLCQVLDSHPEAAKRFVDAGERRASVCPGTRVSKLEPSRVTHLDKTVGIMGRALCALDGRPRAYVLASASLMSFQHFADAEQVAKHGLSEFGVRSEGGALALVAAMAARQRGDWPDAKHLYLGMHDCQITSYSQVGFASATLAAVEANDSAAATHFYIALLSSGVHEGFAHLNRIAAMRRSRGEGDLVSRILRKLRVITGSSHLDSHA